MRPSEAPVESLIPRASVLADSGSNLLGGAPEASPPGRVTPSGQPSSTTISTTIKVHVAGAVKVPGVYALPAGSRVVDAVRAAGGATTRADLERINLAQTVIDTEQIFVPSRRAGTSSVTVAPRLRPDRRRPAAPTTVPTDGASPVAPGDPSGGAPERRINLNSATAAELDALPGVGPATARSIVTHRTRKGPFLKVEDLLNVSGIGPAKFAALRDLVTV